MIRSACGAAMLLAAGALPLAGQGTPPPATSAPPAQAAPAQPNAVAPVQPGPPALTPAQQEDKRRLQERARTKSATPEATTAAANERLDLWKMVLIIDPADVEARLGYEQAQRDLEAARAQETLQAQQRDTDARTQASAAQARREQLGTAERALYARDLNTADQAVGVVLAQTPDDPRALSLRDAIRQTREARAFTRRMLMAAGAMLVLAVGIIVLLKKLSPRRDAAREGGGAKAVVKVVDGIGRGKLMLVEKEVFRIGAADGERPDEKNDLVVSDSGALVSRYHCTILRKGRDYFLLDSSLNGTRLNGRRLDRGEHHPLEDGDEFVLADAARVKFLMT
ncbi:MAG TPA: FHA domain-containing protein [Longimicrobiaceae bacterium]|nr:FHA domain-containing protein [Longimicrobiaceae bacterium]